MFCKIENNFKSVQVFFYTPCIHTSRKLFRFIFVFTDAAVVSSINVSDEGKISITYNYMSTWQIQCVHVFIIEEAQNTTVVCISSAHNKVGLQKYTLPEFCIFRTFMN